MLFSATFPKTLRELAGTHLAIEHVRFTVGRAGSTHGNIRQVVMEVDPSQKRQACLGLLNSMPPARTIIFVNSKRMADELDDFLYNQGMPTTSIHADRTQREREDAMRAFRAGRAPILIATGISARGIDVHNIVHVINYDMPSMDYGGIEEYTHRIGKFLCVSTSLPAFADKFPGRTGRIGHRGLATSFYTEKDEAIASVLVRTLLETQQAVPDFLAHHIPEGDDLKQLKFESENEVGDAFDEEYGNNAGGAWGTAEDGNENAAGAWGAAMGGAAAVEVAASGGAWDAPAPESSANTGAWDTPIPTPSAW